MKTIVKTCVIACLFWGNESLAQRPASEFIGEYADGAGDLSVTRLTLLANGTFRLKTVDPVFSYTYETYETSGKWTCGNNEVVLNPDKMPREKEIFFRQKMVEDKDSVTIKIIYKVRQFKNEQFRTEKPFDFDQLTVFVNKESKYYNLVRHEKRRVCAFTPKTRNQCILDSTNTLKIPKMEISKLGVITYGFENPIWLDVSDTKANYFEIEIVQPVDEERTPRNKKVIIKGERAYFYEIKGKVDTSGILLPLTKRK